MVHPIVHLLATAVGAVVLSVWSLGISCLEDQISLKTVAKLLFVMKVQCSGMAAFITKSRVSLSVSHCKPRTLTVVLGPSTLSASARDQSS